MRVPQDWERLYFDDFDVWCERQIEALNRHKENLPADLDAERIAEEWQLIDPKLEAMLPECTSGRASSPSASSTTSPDLAWILDEEWWPLWADPPEPAG